MTRLLNYLRVLANAFTYINSPNIKQTFLSYFDKHNFLSKKRVLFIPTSGHTGSTIKTTQATLSC